MDVKAIIDTLNNLTFGELSRLSGRVREARRAARAEGLYEIAEILDDALGRLDEGDVKGFRKKISHAVSRLGHAR
jgi:hypothetical protein